MEPVVLSSPICEVNAALARIMHKFSNAAPPPSSERSEEIIRRVAPTDPQSGYPNPQAGTPGSNLPYRTFEEDGLFGK